MEVYQLNRQHWASQRGAKPQSKRRTTVKGATQRDTLQKKQVTRPIKANTPRHIFATKIVKTEQPTQAMLSTVEQVIRNAQKAGKYLFIGKAYGIAYDRLHNGLFSHIRIQCYSANAKDIIAFIKFVDSYPNLYNKHHVIILLLKNTGKSYQKYLLAPIEQMQIPVVVFIDGDELLEPFASRFTSLYKQPNMSIQSLAFVPPDTILSRKYIANPYECPSLIKLGKYEKLPSSEKSMDVLISKLSGDGSVYPEVLSCLQPPIEAFDDDIKLEALSLLKRRYEGGSM
jgi:hypothetical protein